MKPIAGVSLTTSRRMTKPRIRAARSRAKLQSLELKPDLRLVRSKSNHIQWPTEQQIRAVSSQLARIQQIGIKSEIKGDYFRSGDLAFQMQEIIRATAELSKRSQRADT